MNIMKFSTATICALFIISFFPALAQEKPTFKVLTYNIYHGENPAIADSSNLAQLANLIIQLQPEVIALQEVDSMTTRSEQVNGKKINIVEYLSKETGYRGYFAKAMNYAEGGYGEGILVKKGSGYKTQLLPTPAGGEPRAMAWVKIELKNQDELYFGATHLCHQFPENRIAQLKAITNYADSLNRPVFWAGDLNFAPDSEEYKSISDKWVDSGLLKGDNSPTFDSPDGERIDYVWFQSGQFELVDYQVLKDSFSDHYPVLVTLRYLHP